MATQNKSGMPLLDAALVKSQDDAYKIAQAALKYLDTLTDKKSKAFKPNGIFGGFERWGKWASLVLSALIWAKKTSDPDACTWAEIKQILMHGSNGFELGLHVIAFLKQHPAALRMLEDDVIYDEIQEESPSIFAWIVMAMEGLFSYWNE